MTDIVRGTCPACRGKIGIASPTSLIPAHQRKGGAVCDGAGMAPSKVTPAEQAPTRRETAGKPVAPSPRSSKSRKRAAARQRAADRAALIKQGGPVKVRVLSKKARRAAREGLPDAAVVAQQRRALADAAEADGPSDRSHRRDRDGFGTSSVYALQGGLPTLGHNRR